MFFENVGRDRAAVGEWAFRIPGPCFALQWTRSKFRLWRQKFTACEKLIDVTTGGNEVASKLGNRLAGPRRVNFWRLFFPAWMKFMGLATDRIPEKKASHY